MVIDDDDILTMILWC